MPSPRPENLAFVAELESHFSEFLERAAVHQSPVTIRWYVGAFRMFRQYLREGAGLPPERFSLLVQALDEWSEWNLKRGVSPLTVNTYWRALRPFFNDREKREGVSNPYRLHRAPRFQPAPPKALAVTECRRILTAAANYPRWDAFQRARAVALLGTMLYSGLRRSELLSLLYTDVNLVEGTIRVRRGKGAYGGKFRVAEISPDLKTILQSYLRERSRRGYTNPEFFSSTRVSGGVTVPTLTVVVRKVRQASGVHFSSHVLRHSFVTHLLRNGVPLYVARDLAGHSNISSTMIYTRVFDEDRKSGVRKLSFR
ncbi:MAG: site-specific integrase [Thermoanaerobaculia bacterium]